jgi:hypothetical protein
MHGQPGLTIGSLCALVRRNTSGATKGLPIKLLMPSNQEMDECAGSAQGRRTVWPLSLFSL